MGSSASISQKNIIQSEIVCKFWRKRDDDFKYPEYSNDFFLQEKENIGIAISGGGLRVF
jgi:hypothetical protein